MKRRKKILKNTNRPVKKIITSDSNKGANNPSKVYRTIVTMIETPDAARPKGFAVSPSARFLTGGKKCRRAKKVPVTRINRMETLMIVGRKEKIAGPANHTFPFKKISLKS